MDKIIKKLNIMKNRTLATFLVIFTILISCEKKKSTFKKVDNDLAAFDKMIKDRKEEFYKVKPDVTDKEWVKKKLKFMFMVDQYARRFGTRPATAGYSEGEKKYFWNEYTSRFNNIDLENANELKQLLKVYGWIKISEFGEEAEKHAWIIVQHADHDVKFQKFILEQLNVLRFHKETDPKNYAFLYDRLKLSFNDPSKRELQRYGTQGHCEGQFWNYYPVEDEKNLDKIRAEIGLEPIKDYSGLASKACIGE